MFSRIGFALTILVLALVDSSAFAQKFSQAEALLQDAMDILRSGEPVAKPRLERLRAASLVSEYCRVKLHKIPRLSPREEDWLRGELRGGLDRQVRARISREGMLFAANEKFSECVGNSEVILVSGNIDTERILWAQLVGIFMVIDIREEFLDINKASKSTIFEEFEYARVHLLMQHIVSGVLAKVIN